MVSGLKTGFNSLQAGNFFQTHHRRQVGLCGYSVSIPFKRETSSKLGSAWGQEYLPTVSIPFKRETSSKLVAVFTFTFTFTGFNSLQAGNFFQTHHLWMAECYPTGVSIPFKRETSSKPKVGEEKPRRRKSFNSLQAGNFFQTHPLSSTNLQEEKSFNSLQAGNFFQT